jgi:hypothetical protein
MGVKMMKKHTHCILWRLEGSSWNENPRLYKSERDAEKAKKDLEIAYPFLIFAITKFGLCV